MDLTFKVSGRIARPVDEVFEAVVDPARLSRYFTMGGAEGRMEEGATVMWAFHEFPGRFPVYVDRVVPNREIVFRWDAEDPGATPGGPPYRTTVTILFEALEDGRTLVTISETGWRETPEGLAASYGNSQGWMQMLCSLKAWIEHGIALRADMFS